jgi:hypothetical protein
VSIGTSGAWLRVELTLRTVPDCPNAATFADRLATALAVIRCEISDEHTAAQAGMHGSPTLLINGADPVAATGQAPSLSRRLYRDEEGRARPARSVEEPRRAIAAASDA